MKKSKEYKKIENKEFSFVKLFKFYSLSFRRVFYFAFLLLLSLSQLHAQEKKFSSFNDADFVEFLIDKEEDEYIIGEGSQSVTAKIKIFPFKINRYETTYSLWHKVYVWAVNRGYVFANPGQEGSSGSRGKDPTAINCYEPVTNINWHDAIVWCNAYSEMDGRQPCYTYGGKVLKDATDTASCDLAICAWDCEGYRLPSEAEWEYAARKTSSSFQSGSLASGQVNSEGKDDSSIPATEVAWYFENTEGTKRVGTAGTPFQKSSPPEPASGNPNGSGLFDMSGNVLEFCWDWEGSYDLLDGNKRCVGPEFGFERVLRGGSWNEYTLFIAAGDRYSYDPNEAYDFFGFRIAQTVHH